MTKDRKICVGKFVGVHGVRGQLRLASFTDDPEAIFTYAPLTDEKSERVFALTFRGVAKDCYLVSVDGVADRTAAESLKGVKLYVDRDALPEAEEDEYYFADLMGLSVRDAQGTSFGKVVDVHDYGAGVFLEILPPHGKSFMLPFKDAFVPVVDIAVGFIEVVIPEGWLVEEKKEKGEA